MSILTVCYEIEMNAENITAYTVCTTGYDEPRPKFLGPE